VFEHIEKPQASFKEIYRILKPNGILYVIFPNKSVWYEGHIGLYFPHWFKKNSFLQISYLRLCYLFGLGRKRHLKVEGWRHILNDVTFYHKAKSIEKIIFESFANKPESVAGEYINFRIKKSRFKIILNYINKVFRFILVFITNKRAGSILKVIKN
jgi:SAM-dependent methyltransferase